MKKYAGYQIVIIIVFSMATNILGRLLADYNQLPLWADSFGTFFTAYCLGPWCAVMVGVAGNIIHGFFNPVSFAYSLTSVFIALIAGSLAKKGWMESVLKTMSLSVIITLVCTMISCVLNFCFNGGKVSNIWGQGIADLLETWGLQLVPRQIIGQFYVDFLDKVVTLCAVYSFIRLYRFLKPLLPEFLKQKKITPACEEKNKSAGIKKTFVLLFVFFICAFNGEKTFAQIRDYNSFVHIIYNKENGLPGGKANDIVATNDGILWIGTYEGLYRHNGHEFRLMNDFEKIKAVRCLYVDDEGRLFVGTNDNGLSILINENIVNSLDERDGLPSDSVRSIIRGSDGLYYVGTTESLAILSISDGIRIKKVISEVEGANFVCADENGHIAVITASGSLFILSRGEIIWSSSESSLKFTSASFSPDGTLYASCEDNYVRLYSLKVNEENVTLELKEKISCSSLRHINSLKFFNGLFFVCSDTGIGYIQDKNFYRLESGSFNNSIDNMTEDYQGNLWFTSSRQGLLKMCESSFSEIYSAAGLKEAVVNSVAEFKGNLYFATDDGLTAIDCSTGLPLHNKLTDMLSSTRIRCLTRTRAGDLWICTKSRGLIYVSFDEKILVMEKGVPFRVAIELFDGTIAAGGNDGIIFVKDNRIVSSVTLDNSLECPMVLSLSQSEDGSVLAGTDGGGLAVIKLDSIRNEWNIKRVLKKSDGLSSNVILRTVNDCDGLTASENVFAVTSNGLCYINSENYSVKILSNFPYSNNYDMLVMPDKNIFVLSSAGIFVVNRDELLSGKKVDYELLDLKKGLRGSLTANSWNYLDQDANLYLSCDSGASKINLNTYDSVDQSYRIQLKSILLDGVRHTIQKDIPFVISEEVEKVEIIPEIVNFSINNPYVSLFLEGVDETPSVMLQSDLSSLIYTKLSAGTYKLHISVLDSKGLHPKEENCYTIIKSYHLYDNWWFILYTLCVFVLAIAWLTWYITSALLRQRMTKQEREMEAIRNQVRMGNETIFSIAKAVEARDKSTGRHSFRVAEYSVLIAKELGFSQSELDALHKTGLLHDIGKIGVPDSILNKPARLTDEEYEVMKTHTLIGGEILKDFTLIANVSDGAKYHHERYDGRGYPNGLKGEEIPLNARIIGIADAFDAMTANRVYRKALDMDYVIGELKKCSGSQFDPGLVDIMLGLIKNGRLNVAETVEASAVEGE